MKRRHTSNNDHEKNITRLFSLVGEFVRYVYYLATATDQLAGQVRSLTFRYCGLVARTRGMGKNVLSFA